jgi:hypothetical protein
MFRQQNIHKCIWTSIDGKTHNQTDHMLIYIGSCTRVYKTYEVSGELTMILTAIWWLQKLDKDWD